VWPDLVVIILQSSIISWAREKAMIKSYKAYLEEVIGLNVQAEKQPEKYISGGKL
jgi:hypothetical protein